MAELLKEYLSMRATKYQGTQTTTSKVLRELGKLVVERSSQRVTQTERLIKSVIAKMDKVLKNYKAKQGRKDYAARTQAYLEQLKMEMFDVETFTEELNDKQVATLEPVVLESLALEHVRGAEEEPHEKRRKLTESALLALISDRHSIQLDRSTRLYFLKLPVTESGRSYLDLTRTVQGAKSKGVGNRALAHILNCYNEDLTLITEDDQDLASDANRVSYFLFLYLLIKLFIDKKS